MDTMRERFTATVTELLETDTRIALVTADIGVLDQAKRRYPDRVINVGIREQLMIGITAGLALEGFRPIAHSYAPFLIERPFEQVKLDLAHQDVGAILVSVGGSYDWPQGGRTHQSPGDVALIATLPDWEVFVPGHPDEAEAALRHAAANDTRTYIRLSLLQNNDPNPGATETLVVARPGPLGAPVVLAVGPMLDNVLEATAGLDVAVAYTSRIRPLDAASLRHLVADDLIVVEPYLKGTSAHNVIEALGHRSLRLTSLGVGTEELRMYGSPQDHEAAWGLDPPGLRRSILAAVGI